MCLLLSEAIYNSVYGTCYSLIRHYIYILKAHYKCKFVKPHPTEEDITYVKPANYQQCLPISRKAV